MYVLAAYFAVSTDAPVTHEGCYALWFTFYCAALPWITRIFLDSSSNARSEAHRLSYTGQQPTKHRCTCTIVCGNNIILPQHQAVRVVTAQRFHEIVGFRVATLCALISSLGLFVPSKS